MQKSADVETQTTQPVNAEWGQASDHQAGEQSTEEKASGQPWLAVGNNTTDCAPKVSREIDDGILFKVKVSMYGRTYTALIDSGASRCYVSPETVDLLELQCTPELVHLELADGSKIRSTSKVRGVMCTVGTNICKLDLTVTKLLHDVDLVLGMTWLQQWNPLIDWVHQVMYIRTYRGWDKIRGLFLSSEHAVGTVKIVDDYLLASLERAPDITILKNPQFWNYSMTGEWQNSHDHNHSCKSFKPIEQEDQKCSALKKVVQYDRVANTIQKKTTSKAAGQRQMISHKQMQKLMKKGETCYLAMVLPNKSVNVQQQQ